MANLTNIKIKNLKCLQDIEIDSNKNKILIYGRNGSGKTTLSNALGKPDDYQNAIGLSQEDITAKTQIQLNCKKDGYIHVFNDIFVHENLYLLGMKKDATNKAVLQIGKEAIEISKTQDKLNKVNTKLKNIYENNILSKLNTLVDDLKNKDTRQVTIYNKLIIPNPANDKIEFIRNLKKWSEEEYTDTTEILNKINKLKSKNDDAITIKNLLEIPINIDTEKLTKIFKKEYDLFQGFEEFKANYINKSVNEEWFDKGLQHIHENNSDNCPFCQQSISNIFDQFTKYYLDQTNEIKRGLRKVWTTLKGSIEQISTIRGLLLEHEKFITNNIQLFNLPKVWNTIPNIEKYNNAVNNLKKQVEEKGTNLSIKINDDTIKNFINTMNEFNKIIQSNLSIIEEINFQRKNTAKQRESTRKELAKTSLINFAISHKDIVDNIHNNILAKEREENTLKDLKLKSSNLRTKGDELVKLFNKILDKLGLSDLYYVKSGCKIHLNIDDKLLNISDNNNDLIEIISEGQRRSIAFAYYLASIILHNGFKKYEDLNKFTFVIDDPLTSVDSFYKIRILTVLQSLLEKDFIYEIDNNLSSLQLIILVHDYDLYYEMFNRTFSNTFKQKEPNGLSYNLIVNNKKTSVERILSVESDITKILHNIYKSSLSDTWQNLSVSYNDLRIYLEHLIDSACLGHLKEPKTSLKKIIGDDFNNNLFEMANKYSHETLDSIAEEHLLSYVKETIHIVEKIQPETYKELKKQYNP